MAQNPRADIKNPNYGTSGTNKTYDYNQGNRGKQMNPIPNNAHKGGSTGKR
jgi:hypothetical protein